MRESPTLLSPIPTPYPLKSASEHGIATRLYQKQEKRKENNFKPLSE